MARWSGNTSPPVRHARGLIHGRGAHGGGPMVGSLLQRGFEDQTYEPPIAAADRRKKRRGPTERQGLLNTERRAAYGPCSLSPLAVPRGTEDASMLQPLGASLRPARNGPSGLPHTEPMPAL